MVKLHNDHHVQTLVERGGRNHVLDVAFNTKEWFQSHGSNVVKTLVETHGTMNDVSDLVFLPCLGT